MILKKIGNNNEFNLFESNPIVTNNSDVPFQVLDELTTNLSVGKFKIQISYNWSINSAQLQTRFDFDGVTFGVDDGSGDTFIHSQTEASDGQNPDNRGTGQIQIFSKNYFVDVAVAGQKTVELWINSSIDGQEASIWDLNIEITKVQ